MFRHIQPRQLKRYLPLVLAFLSPCAILAAAYMVMKIYPFGHRSILVIDLDIQYIDYYAALRRMVFEGESPFYSWGKMLGGNMLGIVSYYLSSPFSIFTLLFSEEYQADSIFWMTMAKVGSAGLAMALYLKHAFKAQGLALVAFSTPYALMAYVVMYSYNILWLDGLIFLPLIALGIEKIIRSEPTSLYLASLALMLITNFYIGYMMCIFAVLYFLYQAWLCYPSIGRSGLFRQSAVFALSSLLAGGMASFLLVPTYFSLSAGKLGFDQELFGLFPQFHLLDLLPKLLVGAYEPGFGDIPNIYCGLAMGLLALLYFANREVSTRNKLGGAALLGVLLFSFYWSGLDLIWHGLQVPQGFAYRYSFVFSFLVIILAYQGWQRLNTTSQRSLLVVGLAYASVVGVAKLRGVTYIPNYLLLASFVLICAYILLLWQMRQGREITRAPFSSITFIQLLTVAVLFEAGLNTIVYIRSTHLEHKYRDRASYQSYRTSLKPMIQQIKEADSGFYRIEKTFFRTENDPLNFDYPAISHYSSSIDRPALNFLKNAGFAQAHYRVRYTGQTIPMDSILGIKYLLSEEPLHSDYAEIQQNTVESEIIPGGQVFTYQNPYALPIGFMVQRELAQLHHSRFNPIFWQDQILRAMTGFENEAFFTPVQIEAVTMNNVTLDETSHGWLRYTRQSPELEATIAYHLLVQGDGPVYSFLVAQGRSKMGVWLGDRFLGYYGENSENNQMLLLGDYVTGDRLTVKTKLMGDEAVLFNESLFYQLGIDRFRQAHQYLAANPLEISTFTDITIDGRVIATGEKSLLFTSIPYDPAWKVFLDGQTVETFRLLDTFLGIQVPPGEHVVRFEYHPRGWLAGWAITGSSLVLAVAFYRLRRKN